MNNQKLWRYVGVGSIFVLSGCIVGLLFVIFSDAKKSVTSINNDKTTTGYLICENIDTIDSILTFDNTESVNHRVVITTKNDEPISISYLITANYSDETKATQNNTRLRVDYDKYRAEHYQDKDSLSIDFMTVKKSVKINFNADIDDINSTSMETMMLEKSKFIEKRNWTLPMLSNNYEEQGFKCN